LQSATCDVTLAFRDNPYFGGTAYGNVAVARTQVDVVVFKDTPGSTSSTYSVYINVKANYNQFDFSVESSQQGVALIEPVGASSTTATGAFVASMIGNAGVTTETSTATTSYGNYVYTVSATSNAAGANLYATTSNATGGSIACAAISCTSLLTNNGNLDTGGGTLKVNNVQLSYGGGPLYMLTPSINVYGGGSINNGTFIINNSQQGTGFGTNQGGLGSYSGLSFKCMNDSTERHLFDTTTGNAVFKGSLSLGQSTVGSSALNVTGSIGATGGLTTGAGQTVSLPGVVGVNDATDSGVSRGLRLWSSTDNNWAAYVATSGANKSSMNGTTCASLDGRTAHHIRNRVNNAGTSGFLWENSSEACLMSLTADTGNLFVKGMFSAGGTGGLLCTAMSNGRSLGSFLTTGTLTGNANAPLNWTNIHSLAPLANIFNGNTTSYGIRLTGYINIQYAQQYTFYFNTQDDATYVYIDGALVIAQGSYSGTQASANYTFSSAGWKPIYIYHSQTGGGESLRLQWSTTGTGTIAQQDIPGTSLAYDQSEAKGQALGGPLFYSDATYNVGIGNANPSSTLDVTGSIRATSGLKVSNNTSHLQSSYGSIGFISYSDGATYYQLATSSGDSGGGFNSLRPFQWNLANGNVGLANNQVTFAHSTGAMACTSIAATGAVSCAGLTATGTISGGAVAISNSTSTGNPVTMTNFAPLLPVGNYMQTNFGVAGSSLNTGWLAFNNAGGSGSSSNYLAMGLWGLNVGTGSFNVCGNGNFGFCTASPQYTVHVSGTGRYTGSLASGAFTCTSINASGNFSGQGGTFSSVYSTNTLGASGFIAPTVQGSYVGWNRNGGFGQTCFANSRGTGGGGWEFVSYSSTNVFEQIAATIDSTGGLSCAGITCKTINTQNSNISAGTGSISGGAISGTTGSLTGTMTLNSGDQDKIYLTNASPGSKITHETGWNVGYYAGPSNSPAGAHKWYVGTAAGWSNQMILTNGASLGVGTNNPSARLHISGGNAQFDSNVTVSGTCTVGSFGSSIIPSADNTYNLGSAANRWGTVYAKTFYGMTRKYWNKSNLGLINETTGFHKIATLLNFTGANNSVLRLSGQFGGEAAFAVIDMYVSTRPSPPISVTGTAYGSVAAAKTYGDIVVYLEADSTYSVYLSSTKQFGSWDLSIEGSSGNVLLEPSSTNTAAPTGTLQTPSSLSQLVTTSETTTGTTTFACSNVTVNSAATTNTVPMAVYTPSLGTGQYLLKTFGTAASAYNCGYTGFNNTGGAGSTSNYAAFGLYGYNIGTGTLNACGNGNFGICTTAPAATLDV
jgi:hypothetical protein